MIDIKKQINYWQISAQSDIETAEILINKQKYIQGLFFCHLCMEKIIKALVVKQTSQIPPKSHNLEYLCEQSQITVTNEQKQFMAILMKYQLEGRYPEYYPVTPSITTVNNYLCKTKELYSCLKQML